jgi:hypothetical protein
MRRQVEACPVKVRTRTEFKAHGVESPEDRLKGTAQILRTLAGIAARAKAA